MKGRGRRGACCQLSKLSEAACDTAEASAGDADRAARCAHAGTPQAAHPGQRSPRQRSVRPRRLAAPGLGQPRRGRAGARAAAGTRVDTTCSLQCVGVGGVGVSTPLAHLGRTVSSAATPRRAASSASSGTRARSLQSTPCVTTREGRWAWATSRTCSWLAVITPYALCARGMTSTSASRAASVSSKRCAVSTARACLGRGPSAPAQAHMQPCVLRCVDIPLTSLGAGLVRSSECTRWRSGAAACAQTTLPKFRA